MCHASITHGIVSGAVLMTDRLSATRGEQQKFATLHTSGSLMPDVPVGASPDDANQEEKHTQDPGSGNNAR